MTLNKDQIQKIALGAILFIGLIYCYFVLLLGPLKGRQEMTRASITELGPKITQARGQIRRAQDLETAAPVAAVTVKQLSATIPDGSPVAWFPTLVAEFFKRHGVDKTTTRMNSETKETDLPGFRRLSWGVDLPKVEMIPFGQALAAFENEEPLAEIVGLVVEPNKDDVETQRVFLTINNLAKQ
jgi:hypothetical protein